MSNEILRAGLRDSLCLWGELFMQSVQVMKYKL